MPVMLSNASSVLLSTPMLSPTRSGSPSSQVSPRAFTFSWIFRQTCRKGDRLLFYALDWGHRIGVRSSIFNFQ